MKLIVDIDEDVYTRLFDNGIQDNEIAVDDVCEMARALRLGTPLDEVKAKMEERPDTHYLGELKSRSNVGIMMFGDGAYNRGIKHVIEILDNIGKESEET